MRLVIVGCCGKKAQGDSPRPAIELYDGPVFRTLRWVAPADVSVWVFSGLYGLIPGSKRIVPYDQVLDRTPMRVFPGEEEHLLDALATADAVCVAASLRYEHAIVVAVPQLLELPHVTYLRGRPGVKLARFRNWLGEQNQTFEKCGGCPSAAVLAIAQSFVSDSSDRIWVVRISGRDVPVKWLYARITGSRPSDFHTTKARRHLESLGLRPFMRL